MLGREGWKNFFIPKVCFSLPVVAAPQHELKYNYFHYKEGIIQHIKEAGFKIQIQKEVTLTKDLASQFYHEHEGKEFFDGLTDHMARYVLLYIGN